MNALTRVFAATTDNEHLTQMVKAFPGQPLDMCKNFNSLSNITTRQVTSSGEQYVHAIKGDGFAFHLDELLSGTQQNDLSFVRD